MTKSDKIDVLAEKFNEIPTADKIKRLQLLCLIVQSSNIEAVRKNDTASLLFTNAFREEAAIKEVEILMEGKAEEACRKIAETFDPNVIDVSLVNLSISDRFSDGRCYLNLGLPNNA